jgi:MYXO-CTERM domain-containing protein
MTSTTAALNLDTFLDNDTNKLVTFALLRSVSDSNVDYNFATKENLTPGIMFPTLTLPNALVIPEPTSAALATMLLAAVAVGRRRRS